MKTCNKCELCNSATKVVMGEGPVPCPLMLLGEAPGYQEDRTGRPFVGSAGELLDFVLGKLGLDRKDIYITNVLKCRPPKNELPSGVALSACIKACAPILRSEIKRVKPKVIVHLGGTAIRSSLGKNVPVTRIEGIEFSPQHFAAVHPAFVLRSPSYEANLGRVLAIGAKLAGLKVKPKGQEHGRFEYETWGGV